MLVKQSDPESQAFDYEFALESILALCKAKGNDAVSQMQHTLERAGKDSLLVAK